MMGEMQGFPLQRNSKSTFVSVFIDRQRNMSIQRNISIHRYIGCLHEIKIKIKKNTAIWLGEIIGWTLIG